MKQLRDYPLFAMDKTQKDWLDSHSIYLGDIHNHCGISYGYGTLEKAIDFARQSLDFFSATGHFAWPDMESAQGMEIPADVRAYHKAGFAKLRRGWKEYLEEMQAAETPVFIPFPSYEYHSFYYGDYTVLCRDQGTKLPCDPAEGEKDTRLERLIASNNPEESHLLAFPHHIGYKQGYRGINWDAFNEKTSPIVEILSMHGCAESHEARLQYLHTMGPRSRENTMQGGLARGLHFGVLANTDHHNASPGSYGFGRTGVYAPSLSRESIWENIQERRSIAYSGDGIRIAFFANDRTLGSIVKDAKEVNFDAYAVGFDKIDRFELVHDEEVIASGKSPKTDAKGGFIPITFGWGKKNAPCYWDITIKGEGVKILDAVPRLKGKDMVDPLETPTQDEREKTFFAKENGSVHIKAATDGNRTATTNSCQGCVIETDGNEGKLIVSVLADWKDKHYSQIYTYDIADLKDPESEYIDGFVSPAIQTGAFTPLEKAASEIHVTVAAKEKGAYYIRCYEMSGDAAYTSPIWIE